MGTAGDILGIGVSGLIASQRGLATAGHNVSNVNTPGYSRQRADFNARLPQFTGAGFLGTGVEVGNVRRIFDGFINVELRNSTASHNQVAAFHQLASQVDNILADPAGGLTPAMQDFFTALHDLADDPSSIAARQVVLSGAETLVERFHTLDQRMADLRSGVNEELANLVGEINSLTRSLGQLNHDIILAQAANEQQPANDLLDQRDELIRRIAEKVDVTVIEQGDGAINLAVGTGQALVVGTVVTPLNIVKHPADPLRHEVGYTASGGTTIVSDLLTGGEIAGVLDFRRQVLDETQNSLGRVAIGLARTINDQHKLGVDLHGLPGGNLFNELDAAAPTVASYAGNTGTAVVTVKVSDVNALTTSDYRLDRSAGTFTLTRLSDGTAFTLDKLPGNSQTVDGLTISITGGSADGDKFQILPTRGAARDIALVTTTTEGIAAAAPVRAAGSLANTGSAQISTPSVNSPDDDLTITFNDPPVTFDVVDDATGATLAAGLSYVAGNPVSFNGLTFTIDNAPAAGDAFTVINTVTSATAGNTGTGTIGPATVSGTDPNLADTVTITFDDPPGTFSVAGATTGSPTSGLTFTSGEPISFNGWTVVLSGAPQAGDTFTVEGNAGGVGDNRNALALAGLQTENLLSNGQATYGDAYGQLVAEIGAVTRQADINREAQATLLTQIQASRDAVSGVNLDEEAADLLRFEQQYQASAQVINIAESVFQTLIEAVAR